MLNRRSAIAAVLAGTGTLGLAQTAFPTKPVRWIVPFGAGGPGDVIARTVSMKVSQKWGQSVVVDNKPGGYTTIAASEAARAAPDGYTLFQPIDGTLIMNPFMFERLPYAVEDFTLITTLAALPILLVVHPSLPAQTAREFVDHAKARPGSLSYGFVTGSTQIAGHLFCEQLGITMTPIPYKSSADVARALVGGEIQIAFDGPTSYLGGHVQSGRVRFLANLSRRKFSAIAQLPGAAEVGYSGLGGDIWHGLLGPARMDRALRDRIRADVQEALLDASVKARLADFSLEPLLLAGDEFQQLVRTDAEKLGPVIKRLGIKVQ